MSQPKFLFMVLIQARSCKYIIQIGDLKLVFLDSFQKIFHNLPHMMGIVMDTI